MSLTASDRGGGDYQIPPEGNHVARCVRVIDLGTQRDSYMGKPKIMHKAMVAWELPDEKAVFDEERGEEPFLVSKEYTVSLGERANLRHDLEAWRGKQFTEAELKAFDISKLIGAACMVNVVHRTSKNNRNYASITAVTPLPKGVKKADVPKQTLPSLSYQIEDGNNEVFKALPEWIQKKIMESEEWTTELAPADSGGEGDEPF
jgi:hypothetical protein